MQEYQLSYVSDLLKVTVTHGLVRNEASQGLQASYQRMQPGLSTKRAVFGSLPIQCQKTTTIKSSLFLFVGRSVQFRYYQLVAQRSSSPFLAEGYYFRYDYLFAIRISKAMLLRFGGFKARTSSLRRNCSLGRTNSSYTRMLRLTFYVRFNTTLRSSRAVT